MRWPQRGPERLGQGFANGGAPQARRARISTSATSPYSAAPSAHSTASAANTIAVSDCPAASATTWPSPASEEMNSPMIAPVKANVAAILVPANRKGSAVGKRTWRNTCHALAPRARHRRSCPGSAARRPLSAPIATGNRLTKVAKASRDGNPTPSHTTNNGPSTTFGSN